MTAPDARRRRRRPLRRPDPATATRRTRRGAQEPRRRLRGRPATGESARRRFLGRAAAVLVLAATPWQPGVGAQEAGDTVELATREARTRPQAKPAAQEPGDTVELAPVVVSVLRGADRLAQAPFAVSVLAGADATSGAAGAFIKDALHGLAGVRVQNRYNAAVGERISIRGFGARAQFGVRGVKVVVDGIPATLPDGQSTLDHLDVGSLGRVEVLRGPGAAFYGNGAGGVILFRSAAPFEGSYRQEVTSAAGSNGLLRLQSTASGSAGRLAYGASVARTRFAGFRDNPTDSGDDPYSRSTRSTANAGFTLPAAGGLLSLRVNGVVLDALNPGSLPAELFGEGSNQAWGFNVARRTRKDVRQAQAGVGWQGTAGPLEADVSVYGVRRQLDNPIPTSVLDLDRDVAGARAVLGKRWREGARAVRLDVGGEAELQNDDRRNFANQGGEPGPATLDQRERVRALAAFGRLALPLGGRARALAALRTDRVDFRADDRLSGDGGPDDSGSRAMTAVSPSLGIHVALDRRERHGAFASVSRSFETPTTTELANRPSGAGGFNPELAPQLGWTVEGGLRGRAARLSYDVAAFWTRLSGQLVPFEVASAPGRRFYRNSGRSRVRGFEASFRAAAAAWLAARASYSYVDARFLDFAVDGVQFDGNRVPGVAPHRLEAAVRATAGSWFAELRTEARGAVPANNANDASADAFVLVDARMGASGVRVGGMELSPFAGLTNLADARYASSVVVNAFGGRYFEPGPGRGAYLGVSMAWQRGG